MKPTGRFSVKKYIMHGDVIKRWFNDENPYAITTEIDLAGYCNHKCSFCWFNKVHNKELFTFKDAHYVFPQISELGGRSLVFTGGGEPTLNEQINEIVQYGCDFGFKIGLVTNGSHLDRLIKLRNTKNLKWVRVSLDAGTKETYAKIHGVKQKTFVNVLSNIEMFKTAHPNVKVGIAYMLMGNNLDEIERIIKIFKNIIEVDYIQFRPLLNTSFLMRRDIIDDLLDYSTNDFKVLFSFDRLFNRTERRYKRCIGNFFVTVIDAKKDVYICCHMRGVDKFKIGNVMNESLRDIWGKRYEPVVTDKCPKLCRFHYANNMLQEILDDKIKDVDFL